MDFLKTIKKRYSDFILKSLEKQIVNNTEKYINRKHKNKTWTPGKDWVQYSGPYFDGKEYKSAVQSLLSEWLIFGQKSRKFELEFAEHLGKDYGVLTNSGSSANLLMVSALKSKKLRNLKRFNIKEGCKIKWHLKQ